MEICLLRREGEVGKILQTNSVKKFKMLFVDGPL